MVDDPGVEPGVEVDTRSRRVEAGYLDRAGRDNVHVIFRTAGEESPIESDELASLRRTWRRDEERSAIGFALDRSGIYGGFHCYGRR